MTARPYWKAASVGGGAPGAGRRPPSPGRSCTLTVTTEYDDGSAPETGDAEVATGYGLRSLTQRATRLGGDIDAGWSPDGFRLRAHLPKESA